jgi:hypothetical protein
MTMMPVDIALQIKSMFDMTGMNGSRDGATVKLAGHWIPPATATSLAGGYRMGEWINVRS